MKKNTIFGLILFIFVGYASYSQVPAVYSNIKYDESGSLYYEKNNEKYYSGEEQSKYSLDKFRGAISGNSRGIVLDFGLSDFEGILYYGLINYKDSKYPSPVFYKRTSDIKKGKTAIDIKKRLSGIYDMSNWESNGYGTLGFRVTDKKGQMIYDGIVSFYYKDSVFSEAPTIEEGPFVADIRDKYATVWFRTREPENSSLTVDNKVMYMGEKTRRHEYVISGLKPSTKYNYKVKVGEFIRELSFKTSPKSGSRKPFTFAYASDSREGKGGGERSFYGVNYYVMKRIAALANAENAAFMQFTGDLISGYSNSEGDMNLQYANWRRSVEPFSHKMPIVVAPGNHEAIGKIFFDDERHWKAMVPDWDFETKSSSALFADNFINPVNGPHSEDGAVYDPNPDKTDFPPYAETVFYYTYDNVAMIVLNSNYFYVPSLSFDSGTGGNLHGYIMDKQLEWLKNTISDFEKDKTVDHIFVTQHTPTFPNSAHVSDDMWYDGDNKFRPVIAGKAVKYGIIERRDQYLDILVNQSSKVRAILTGDEHNYNRLNIEPGTPIHPENYGFEKIVRTRNIWQINNGSAGAPYYVHDITPPWSDAVEVFSTQTALVLFQVEGMKIDVIVKNPETFEIIDAFNISE
ncbi:MAG: metallophosphoesterase [Bacteroidota bacterium]|nr:metallophosphoesterase [Bacteroidota bacterium]